MGTQTALFSAEIDWNSPLHYRSRIGHVHFRRIEHLSARNRREEPVASRYQRSSRSRHTGSMRSGPLSFTGLHTFADPRIGGGKQAPSAKEDLFEIVALAGRERMFTVLPYRPMILAGHYRGRGRQRDDGARSSLRRDAVGGSGPDRIHPRVAAWLALFGRPSDQSNG